LRVLQDINRQYSNLFDSGGGEGSEGSGGSFRDKWGWIATINDMSNNDRQKWDYYFNLNVIELLNTVSFMKDKGESDKAEIERMKRNG
jgi:hypothetical protein